MSRPRTGFQLRRRFLDRGRVRSDMVTAVGSAVAAAGFCGCGVLVECLDAAAGAVEHARHLAGWVSVRSGVVSGVGIGVEIPGIGGVQEPSPRP